MMIYDSHKKAYKLNAGHIGKLEKYISPKVLPAMQLIQEYKHGR